MDVFQSLIKWIAIAFTLKLSDESGLLVNTDTANPTIGSPGPFNAMKRAACGVLLSPIVGWNSSIDRKGHCSSKNTSSIDSLSTHASARSRLRNGSGHLLS
ncbi:MAG: hypothetical protein D4R77_03615 [Planctomycetaceae bacterium]|nr:MAG: hypothetical protein D4R77_03615 [Planctomycetaceae bacterium]